MKHYYPAIFRPKSNNPEGFDLIVPDIPGCFTHGDNMAECMWMAHEAVGCMLEDVEEKDYPKPSAIADVDITAYPAGSFVSLVCFDKEKYDADSKNPIESASSRVGLNIKQTAKLLGAPYRTVQNWFNGSHRPAPWVERLVVEKIYNSV